MIGGLLAQDIPAAHAAAIGVWDHGLAGQRMPSDGTASDLIDALRSLETPTLIDYHILHFCGVATDIFCSKTAVMAHPEPHYAVGPRFVWLPAPAPVEVLVRFFAPRPSQQRRWGPMPMTMRSKADPRSWPNDLRKFRRVASLSGYPEMGTGNGCERSSLAAYH